MFLLTLAFASYISQFAVEATFPVVDGLTNSTATAFYQKPFFWTIPIGCVTLILLGITCNWCVVEYKEHNKEVAVKAKRDSMI